MTADERISLIRVKIERAKKHIGDLEAAIHAFGESHPYKLRAKRDPQTRQIAYYLTAVRDVPRGISAIAGDVLQNLRCTLDHLACQLVWAAGNEPTTRTSFPIAKSAEIYKSPDFRRKVEGMRQEAIEAIDALKPYKGGNDALWQLHQLNNIDKHRLLIFAYVENYATSSRPDDGLVPKIETNG